MSYEPLHEGSIVLRLEFSIADAVYQRGLFAVLGSAVSAWWNRPRLPANLPDRLRADIGLLPPSDGPLLWYSVPSGAAVPALPRRRRQ